MEHLLSAVPAARDQAICLRVWDWSETSQTVALFARELGVVRAVAKGARRADARFSGGLEVTARGEMVAIVKPSERSPDALATLTAWDLQESFPAVRTVLAAFHGAMYMVDVVHHAVRDSDPHPVLFDALLECLRMLGSSDASARSLLRFQWETLVATGYRPNLTRPVGGAGNDAREPYFQFSPSQGGLIGTDRAIGAGGEGPGPLWRVRSETIEAIRAVARTSWGSGAGPGVPEVSAEVVARANRFLAWYLRTVLGSWPSSAEGAFPGIESVEP